MNNKTKNKERRFNIIFVSVSLILFVLLIALLVWLKAALYLAKDEVAGEVLSDYQSSLGSQVDDPLITGQNPDLNSLKHPLDTGQDPVLGENQAPVTIFFFSDYACPYCFEQISVIKGIYDKFKQKVRIIWKDYPDLSLGFNAFSYRAAQAARCADEQGRFWDYNELLYQNQGSFSDLRDQLFLNLADQIKLNLTAFNVCLSSAEVQADILENVSEAQSLGIEGIPYIYVNDQNILGGLSQSELEVLVDAELGE